MVIRKRLGGVALGLVAVVLMGQLPIGAQEPDPKAAPPVAKKQNRGRRVPAYFGQVGLTGEQRDKIYEIVGKRNEKIEALEKQIDAEKAGMLADCEGLLTAPQKTMLDGLRKAAAAARAGVPVRPAETAKTAEAPKTSK